MLQRGSYLPDQMQATFLPICAAHLQQADFLLFRALERQSLQLPFLFPKPQLFFHNQLCDMPMVTSPVQKGWNVEQTHYPSCGWRIGQTLLHLENMVKGSILGSVDDKQNVAQSSSFGRLTRHRSNCDPLVEIRLECF